MNDPDYVVFKDVIVKKELLGELKKKLLSVQKYVEARKSSSKQG